jgi:hypothetical protein
MRPVQQGVANREKKTVEVYLDDVESVSLVPPPFTIPLPSSINTFSHFTILLPSTLRTLSQFSDSAFVENIHENTMRYEVPLPRCLSPPATSTNI